MSRRNHRQHELENAVAEATGEDLHTIRRRGFSIIDPKEIAESDARDDFPEFIPHFIDWDEPVSCLAEVA